MTELKEDLMFLLDEANSEVSLASFKAGSLDYTEELGIMADLLIARGVMIPVRCKECKYGEYDYTECFDYYECHYIGGDWNKGDHFCAYGERKENDCE